MKTKQVKQQTDKRMRWLFQRFRVIMAALMVATAFVACGKDGDDDDDGGGGGGGNGGGSNSLKITAQVDNGGNYNSVFKTVSAYIGAEDVASVLSGVEIATTTYVNGGFTLTLPEGEIPNECLQYLMTVEKFFADLGVNGKLNYSVSGVKAAPIDFMGFNKDNNHIDDFYLMKLGDKTVICGFVYVNANVNVTGGTNIQVSVNLKKGWNRLYVSSGTITTNAQDGLKWYRTDDISLMSLGSDEKELVGRYSHTSESSGGWQYYSYGYEVWKGAYTSASGIWFKPNGTFESFSLVVGSTFAHGGGIFKSTGKWSIPRKGYFRLYDGVTKIQYADGVTAVESVESEYPYTLTVQDGKKGMIWRSFFHVKED
jgi:hypothetical protein